MRVEADAATLFVDAKSTVTEAASCSKTDAEITIVFILYRLNAAVYLGFDKTII